MDEKKSIWPVVLRAVAGYLGLYLDDLLLIGLTLEITIGIQMTFTRIRQRLLTV